MDKRRHLAIGVLRDMGKRPIKDAVLTVRLHKASKKLAEQAARSDGRSLSSYLERLILKDCHAVLIGDRVHTERRDGGTPPEGSPQRRRDD